MTPTAHPGGANRNCHPFVQQTRKMLTGKDDQSLLFNLLVAHLAPSSKAQVNRATADYKARRGSKYPVDNAKLFAGIITATSDAPVPIPANPLTDPVKDESVDVLEGEPVEYAPEQEDAHEDEGADKQ